MNIQIFVYFSCFYGVFGKIESGIYEQIASEICYTSNDPPRETFYLKDLFMCTQMCRQINNCDGFTFYKKLIEGRYKCEILTTKAKKTIVDENCSYYVYRGSRPNKGEIQVTESKTETTEAATETTPEPTAATTVNAQPITNGMPQATFNDQQNKMLGITKTTEATDNTTPNEQQDQTETTTKTKPTANGMPQATFNDQQNQMLGITKTTEATDNTTPNEQQDQTETTTKTKPTANGMPQATFNDQQNQMLGITKTTEATDNTTPNEQQDQTETTTKNKTNSKWNASSNIE